MNNDRRREIKSKLMTLQNKIRAMRKNKMSNETGVAQQQRQGHGKSNDGTNTPSAY